MELIKTVSTDVFDPGAIIAGRYEIIRCLGVGGMATVYLVADKALNNQQCAIKIIHRQFARDKQYLERFIREARVTASVIHPNVVKTYDIGGAEGSVYFSMEYIDGETLERLMELRSFTADEIADLTVEIAKGLSAIHSKGILHRDLKPGNVIIATDGTVKIMDFGVARETGSNLTLEHQMVGSLLYIAPEVWMGKTPTPSVDFYGLGILLYELATGSLPFEQPESVGELIELHVEGEVTRPRDKCHAVPAWLDRLIMRLLEKSPRDRFQRASEIIDFAMPFTTAYRAAYPSKESDSGSQSRINPVVVDPQVTERPRGRTYIFNLGATKLMNVSGERRVLNDGLSISGSREVQIPLPKRAAVVLKFKKPSRDFLYLGFFLISLQLFDGVLTSMGLLRWGNSAEANPLVRSFVHTAGPQVAVWGFKGVAIVFVLLLTLVAKNSKWVKDIIACLSCIYLCAAIVPWVSLLLLHQ